MSNVQLLQQQGLIGRFCHFDCALLFTLCKPPLSGFTDFLNYQWLRYIPRDIKQGRDTQPLQELRTVQRLPGVLNDSEECIEATGIAGSITHQLPIIHPVLKSLRTSVSNLILNLNLK
jgi:hypothetical protein